MTAHNLNAAAFNERYYPEPTARERNPQMPPHEMVRQRERRIDNTYHRVMWLHSFGEWLYYDVVGRHAFDGTHTGLQQLIKDGWVRKPAHPFPKAITNQALTFYSLHTPKRWMRFINEAPHVGVESYRKWLAQFGKPFNTRQLSAAHMETARIKKA